MINTSTLFKLITFHNTIIFFDTQTNKLISSNIEKPTLLKLHVSFNDNNLYIIIKNNNMCFYINDFLENGTVLISNKKKYLPYIRNKNGTISILSEHGFLSARKNGEFLYKHWNKEWENFKLEKIDDISDKIYLYYWNKNFEGKYNVGDILSKFIVEKMSQKKVIHCSVNSPNKFCAIGSIISSGALKSGGVFWGSGSHTEKIEFFFSDLKFLAVRGPLTRKMLINKGYKCPDIYGDPALLLPEFYTPPPIKIQKNIN